MKIKSVKRLPDWLTPEKYSQLQNLNAREWLDQLRYRKYLLHGNPIYPATSDFSSSDNSLRSWSDRMSKHIAALCESPLVRSGPKSAFIVAGKPTATIMKSGDFTYPVPGEAPLRSVTIRDLLDQASRDRSPINSSAVDADRWDYFSRTAPAKLPPGLGDQPLLLGNYENPVLTVDITASDSDLKEFFQAWLDRARKAHNLKHVRRNEPKYLNWVEYGVLPYLDVKIWSMKSGEKPTDKIIAQFVATLSNNIDFDLSQIRGVTATTAKSLMADNSELLSELEALAVLERDVRKK